MQNHKKDVQFPAWTVFDAHCGLVATVVDNRVSRIRSDRDHPLTGGILLSQRALAHEKRLRPRDFDLAPLKRAGQNGSR